MRRSFERLEVRAFGRRLFIKVGGAVTLSALLPGCPEDPEFVPPPNESLGDTGASDVVPETSADVTPPPPPDTPPPPPETEGHPPDSVQACEGWDPDPQGTGADAYPWVSEPPPPGAEAMAEITDNASFYVTSYFGVAPVEPCDWKLELAVRGQMAAVISLEELLAVPGTEREHTLQCIESAPTLMKMDNAVWTGMPLVEFLDLVGVALDEDISGIRLLGADGYEVGLPILELQTPIWIVWKMNGELIPPEHGFPARLLCPNLYGWQNVKQLVGLDFIQGDPVPEYQQDWATHYRLQGLVANPESIALSPSGQTVRLLGKAYAGSDPVTWVGVSTDDGESFQDAELTYAPGPDRWTLWRFDWAPPEPGTYTLKCACETASGVHTRERSGQMFPFEDGMAVVIEVV